MFKELEKIYTILTAFLGESKSGFDESNMQYQFPCPTCIDKYGAKEAMKYNLEVNIAKQVHSCWKCSSEGEETHGSIIKLIKRFGNDELLEEYKNAVRSLRESELYKLNFNENDFNIDTSLVVKEEMKFPPSFKYFKEGDRDCIKPLSYLKNRGIGWDIINEYNLGYTSYQEDEKKSSYRIIIPSQDEFGDINYWTGRNYIGGNRVKYFNPKAEKKNIIFNEDKIQWDADITLVEGPFDHIVVPNSIPLLGKALNREYKLYWELIQKCNSKVLIFIDGDAFSTALEIYKLLNHGRLYDKVRYIPVNEKEDPSSLYARGGYRLIAQHLANARKINDIYLQ